jgi:hypothetical protein
VVFWLLDTVCNAFITVGTRLYRFVQKDNFVFVTYDGFKECVLHANGCCILLVFFVVQRLKGSFIVYFGHS